MSADANAAVAELFEEYADRLEAQGDEYRPRSYRRAAENVRAYPESVADLAADGPDALRTIEGVGESIAEKIVEYVETGSIAAVEAAREELPVDMAALTSVEGIGPRTAGRLYEALGITDLDDLEAAARANEIREVEGFGPTTEANILEGIAFARQARNRELLGRVRPVVERLLGHLEAADAVETCAPAGSIRRWRETVGDIDVLAAGPGPEAVVEHFLAWDAIEDEIEAGTAKASVRAEGVRIDLRVVDPEEFGAAFQYFTGSKDHNVRLRNRAIDRDLKVNEYGVFDVSDVEDPDAGTRVGDRVAGRTERAVYAALDLEWIPPELREDTGEVAAAAEGALPDLLTEADLRGDLHVHTDWSDGGAPIESMLDAAADYGHEYVCLTDHATGPGMVGGVGLDDATLREQRDAVAGAAGRVDIEVFHGVEANIDADGRLSVGEDLLAALDFVVASPHSGLDGEGTDRLTTAIAHPEVDAIGHPSGRRLGRRPGLDLDPQALAEAAADHDTALEVNSNPQRLDLWGTAVRAAVDAGAPIVINTDAHAPAEYEYLPYGVHTARRGWAEPADVLNARSADELRAFLEA